LGEKLWGRTFAGLMAVVYRLKGETALHDAWFQTLRTHQDVKFVSGLHKLGIKDDEPPAVKACKYHYFTNIIGGLAMEYIEESPKKCWIRYLAPMWTYSGLAMLAMPPHVRRNMGAAWHARNGDLMGCDRLQYVRTKTITEGEPYDEGYWVEHDHPVPPDQRFLLKTEIRTPEFDPAKAPSLDPVLWPEERKLRARAKFSGGYVSRAINVLLSMYGVEYGSYIISQTMRCLAIQYIHELKADLNLEGSDARSVALLFAGILRATRQEFELEEISSSHHRIILRTYTPFDWELPEPVRDAYFEFQRMGGRIMNGRLHISRVPSPELGRTEAEIWDFRDTGRWLW
jgi:hypothetical protein